MTNAEVNSNLFYGVHAYGQAENEISSGWYDTDGIETGIISLDTVSKSKMYNAGLKESDRRVEVKGNAYFWPSTITNVWGDPMGVDSLVAPKFQSDRSAAMFADNSGYPLLVDENNIEADPQFADTDMDSWVTGQAASWVAAFRSKGSLPDRNYDVHTGSNILSIAWPLPESLVYDNAALMTAGHDGLPVGDLNWYPEKKLEWEDIQTGLEEVVSSGDKGYNLSQNYPNPVISDTEFNFSIPASGNTSLIVYDITGKVIDVLVDELLSAGNYRYQLSVGNLPSGIYFYVLKSNNYSESKKMVINK